MITAAALVSLLLMACVVIAVPAAADATSYNITFDEKSVKYLAPEGQGNIIVHAGDARPSGNYSWVANASSGTIAPTTGNSGAENFTLKFTASTALGDATISVTLSNGTVNTTARYTVHVVKPVVLSAQVKNSGNVSMQNVPVQFKVDGNEVYRTTFNIAANATKTLTYNWTAAALANGEHSIEIVLDPNSTFINFIDGSKTFTATFFVGDSGFGLINLLLVVMFVILLLIVVFSYMNKGKKKRT